jgi:hypothetical protein
VTDLNVKVKEQFADRFDERFGQSLSERLVERLGESLGEKPKYATRMLPSVAASES